MVVFGEIFLESYKMLLLFSPGVTCMSTYRISYILGAMKQVPLPFTVLQSGNDMACPYEKVTDRPDKYSKIFVHCH